MLWPAATERGPQRSIPEGNIVDPSSSNSFGHTGLAAAARMFVSIFLVCLLAITPSAQAKDPFEISQLVPPRELKVDYFGTHLHRLLPDPGQQAFTDWPPVQVGALRLWDTLTRWGDIEPPRGRFEFRRLDIYVAAAKAHQAAVIYTLGSTPAWASARPQEPGPYGPGSAAEPADMADWDRYVTAVVQRYKGRIAYYELWNEPNFSDIPGDLKELGQIFYSGRVAQMVEMARRARAIIDREDPGAVLLTPGCTGDTKRLELYLSAGGGAYVGGVAFHYYVVNDRDFVLQHQRILAILARQRLSGLRIVNTETGFESKGANADTGSAMLARTMILGAYLGIERYLQYAWDNGRLGMSGTAGGPPNSRHGDAYAAVQRWLLGATLGSCRRGSEQAVICDARRGGERLLILWRVDGAPVSMWTAGAGERVDRVERALVDVGLAAMDQGDAVAVSGNPVAIWVSNR
jgi:hypothetical protein